MSIDTRVHAILAADAYKTYPPEDWDKGVDIEGVNYRILDQVTRPSGYQGTLYQRADTGEMVVAHRGTEFDRELVEDGLKADAGMVLLGMNNQAEDAIAFTRNAIARANRINARRCEVQGITVTGHSLGGTLAQITAYRFGLTGKTFDAYGAAGLVADIPAGGTQVINHVRATDFVSAASKHFGEVRVYASERDIEALHDHGYANDHRFLTDLRNPFGVAFGIGVEAHYSRNFLPDNDLGPDGSVISEGTSARYAQNQALVDKYRHDIALMHGALALPRNAIDAVVDGARHLALGRAVRAPTEAGPSGGQCAAPPASWDPFLPQHPDHTLFEQIRAGVHALDASVGRSPDAVSDRLSASLLVQAKADGLSRVDHVLLSTATPHAPGGEKAFAVQGSPGDPAHLRTQVDIGTAIQTPMAASFQRVESLNQQATQAAEISVSIPDRQPSLSRRMP